MVSLNRNGKIKTTRSALPHTTTGRIQISRTRSIFTRIEICNISIKKEIKMCMYPETWCSDCELQDPEGFNACNDSKKRKWETRC